MNKKLIAIAFLLCSILFIATAAFLGYYYNCIKQNHEGPMDLWATLLLVVITISFLILLYITRRNNITLYDCFNDANLAKKTSSITEKIFNIIFYIIFSPFILVYLIIILIISLFFPEKNKFKPLIKKGFKLKKQKSQWLLSKQLIYITFPFNHSAPLISFDGGTNFEIVFEVERLGSLQEREYLKELQYKYESAHPVDVQRGDAIPPIKETVLYLKKYL